MLNVELNILEYMELKTAEHAEWMDVQSMETTRMHSKCFNT